MTPTIVLAANLPDLDILGLLGGGGPPWYLVHHRGITHSVIGIAVQIAVLPALVWWVGRRIGRRRHEVRFGPLLLAAALGLVSHPLLDALNPYGVRPWIPWDWTWYYGDVAFIVDPWLWLAFGAAACLAGQGRRNGHAAWATAALVAVALLLSAGRARGLGAGPSAAFAAGCAVVGLLRALGVGRRRPGRAVGVALALAAVYLVALGASSRAAERRGVAWIEEHRLAADEATDRTSALAHPAIPWRFDIVVETAPRLHRVRVDLLAGTVDSPSTLARNLDDPVLDDPSVRRSAEYAAWMAFARHRFCAADGEGCLILGDGRFRPEAVADWCNLCVPMPPGHRVDQSR